LIIACIVFIIYGFYQVYRNYSSPRATASKRALPIAFCSAFLLTSVASAIITIRASQDGGKNLCADFAAVQFSCATGFGIAVLSWITTLAAVAGFIVCRVGLRTILVTSIHPNSMGLDPISSPPTTIRSFVQDEVTPKSRFWTSQVGNGKIQPKDLFQQALPRSGQPYWQGQGVHV